VEQLKAALLDGSQQALREDRKGLPGMDGISHLVSSLVTMKGSFIRLTPVVHVIKLFPSSLTMRTNKLEGLSLETLSSQVLGFEDKARGNPIGAPFRYFLLG
jgi:hypothetical protein